MNSAEEDINKQQPSVETGINGQTMDPDEFALEYQRIYRRLWLLAAGVLGHSGEADDVVQQSSLIAFDRIAEFRSGTSLAAWLSEIVRRTALNVRRKAARRKTYASDPNDLQQQVLDRGSDQVQANTGTSTTGKLHSDERSGLSAIVGDIDDDMLRVLLQMPEDARCCLLLRVVDDLSYAEISELMGIPEGTAASHVYRAKSFARQRLSGASPASRKRGSQP